MVQEGAEEPDGLSEAMLDRLEREKKEAIARAEEIIRTRMQLEMKEQELKVREKFIADVEARRKEMEVEVTKRSEKERESLRLQFELDLKKREDSIRAVVEKELEKRLEKEKDSARMMLELDYKRREEQIREGLQRDFAKQAEAMKREMGGPLAGVFAAAPPKEAYPFSAIVGMERVKRAITLAAVNPEIGGVLIWGREGNGKRTLIYGLAALMGEFKRADGAMAKPANSEDRYVRVILPGVNSFVTGVLDPELRVACLDYTRRDKRSGALHISVDQVEPRQLAALEKFASMTIQVEVNPLEKAEDRMEVVKRLRELDTDPARFRRAFEKEEKELRERILKARERLTKVNVPSKLTIKIAQMCEGQPVRTDIALNELARAKAALDGRESVTVEDVQEAADVGISHRVAEDIFKLLKDA